MRGLVLATLGVLGIVTAHAASVRPTPVAMKPIPLVSACSDNQPIQQVELPATVTQALAQQPQLQIAHANVLASQSNVKAAKGAFLPQIGLSAVEEKFTPSNGNTPVVVVGNTVLGGPQIKSAYASLGLKWNLWNDGRDVAALHGAQAGVRSAGYGVDEQLDDTLLGVLKAYADLYEAEVIARSDAEAAAGLAAIRKRAEQRYARGYGTEVAVGQARVDALNAEQTLNGACRDLDDKSAALAQAMGVELSSIHRLYTLEPPLQPDPEADANTLDDLVDASPGVAEARENVLAAQDALKKARGEYGPTLTLSVQRDFLGQDPYSFERANHHIGPADWRIGLEFTQPLFPTNSESADVEKAHADLSKAQASYREARIDAQTKLLGAISARNAAERSFQSAAASVSDAEHVLALTEAQYHAGRKDLDAVEHAKMDLDAAQANVEKLGAQRALAEWTAERAQFPQQFPIVLLRQLHLGARQPPSHGD